MKQLAFFPFLIALLAAPGFAAQRAPQFASIVFHEVVDKTQDLDSDAVTTDRLIALFEFLRGNGWTAISLDDVERAGKLGQSLPERAVLITVDDGYQSAYTRVFPLLLAYRIPALFAVEGSWMEATNPSRKRFISWDEAREMQNSGLVEFASHSYGLHHGTVANPQGNQLPAAAYRRYDSASGYESSDAYRQRIKEDLTKSMTQMRRELGKVPRALVWPYGRYTSAGVDVAREVGFSFALTLDSEPADPAKPMALARYLLSGQFDFGIIANQMNSIDVFGRLPVKAALRTLKDPDRTLALFHDLGVAAPLDGLLVEDMPQLAAIRTADSGAAWDVRARRDNLDYAEIDALNTMGLRCFQVVEADRPRLNLALMTTSAGTGGPSSIADITLIAARGNPRDARRLAEKMKKTGWTQAAFARRFGVWLDGGKPPEASDLNAVVRIFQRNGLSVIGWVDDMIGDSPPAARVAGSVSASSFPVRF